ncbi:MAG: 50S ribosomal protein L4 [Candidatus Eisenbacteria bacterium]|nr:50S ribosomal protein L4 [Candidatus Eisenbacteria bacterium]
MPVARRVTHTGEAQGEAQLPAGAFGVTPNEHVMWEAVRNYLFNQRQGTASVKGRKESRGGGTKPWRQKGTGRARVGTTRSPLWVGGARAFGPHPRDYGFRLPKRIRQLALRSALSTKAEAGEITVVADFRLSEPKTREVAQILRSLEIDRERCLLVMAEHDADLLQAARNIPNLRLQECRLLNAYEVLHADRLLIMESAVERIGEVWS